MSNYDDPVQFSVESIILDDEIDITAQVVNLSIYENIYTPCITGEVLVMDTDGGELLEKGETQGERLEFNEKISFSLTNSNEEQLEFEGVMTGLRNQTSNDSKKIYLIEFSSIHARNNENIFVTKRFKEVSPEQVVNEMLDDKIGAQNIVLHGKGIPMNFVGSRRHPFDVIKYVCTHGLSNESSVTGEGEKGRNQKSKGTTGFLCWETREGYRFASINQIKDGDAGSLHSGFERKLMNKSLSMEEARKGIIDLSFNKVGNTQDKLRSGAFRNKCIVMDLDKGHYKEYTYDDETNMTEKQKKVAQKPTRYIVSTSANEKHNKECERAQPNTGDQRERSLGPNAVRQNTFDDQFGEFTIAPHFNIYAGDKIDARVGKVKSEKDGGFDEKNSGHYVIKAVAHHFFMTTRSAYTKLSTIRTTTQQDDASSTK